MGDKKRKSGGDFVPEKTSCPQQDQRAVEALAAVQWCGRIHCLTFALSFSSRQITTLQSIHYNLSTRPWSAPDRIRSSPGGDNTSCALKFVA